MSARLDAILKKKRYLGKNKTEYLESNSRSCYTNRKQKKQVMRKVMISECYLFSEAGWAMT